MIKNLTNDDNRFVPDEIIEIAARKNFMRIEPSVNTDLINFMGHEKIVDWSTKYADKSTIVFTYIGWQPSPQFLDFAKRRNIHILIYLISTFSNKLLERLSTCYFISRTLKNIKIGTKLFAVTSNDFLFIFFLPFKYL